MLNWLTETNWSFYDSFCLHYNFSLSPQTTSTISRHSCIRVSPDFPILCHILLQEPQWHFTVWSPRFSSPSFSSSRTWPHWPTSYYFAQLPRAHYPTYWSSHSPYYITLSPTFYLLLHWTPFPKKDQSIPVAWEYNFTIQIATEKIIFTNLINNLLQSLLLFYCGNNFSFSSILKSTLLNRICL